MIQTFVESAYVWLQDPHNWGGYAALAALAFLAGWWLRRNDPHREERAMAKKKERKQIADIYSVALDTAFRQGFLTAGQMQHWSGETGRRMGLPDMIPAKDKPTIEPRINPKGIIYYVSIPKVYGTKLKVAVINRLNAMGVTDIADRLVKQRRYRQAKRDILKKVKPVKLP